MLKQLKNNERGVVFVTVLMIITVMTVLAISVVSMNVNQVMMAESEVRRLQAEILAFGALAYTFTNQASSSPSNYISYLQTLDGETFNIEAVVGPPNSGIYNTSSLTINVTY